MIDPEHSALASALERVAQREQQPLVAATLRLAAAHLNVAGLRLTAKG